MKDKSVLDQLQERYESGELTKAERDIWSSYYIEGHRLGVDETTEAVKAIEKRQVRSLERKDRNWRTTSVEVLDLGSPDSKDHSWECDVCGEEYDGYYARSYLKQVLVLITGGDDETLHACNGTCLNVLLDDLNS